MFMGKKQLVFLRRLAMLIQKTLSLQFVDQLTPSRKSQRNYNTLPVYECNEHQFVENIRRLIETSQKFLVNRRISWHDDARYGPAILPDEEFNRYVIICIRKSLRSTVFTKVPFIDDFHRRTYDKGENVHGSGNLMFPRMSIPYYKVEYSVNVWGATYFFTFDALFDPHIVIEKRHGKRLSGLVHVLKYNPPPDRLLTLKLPTTVMVFDVKNMVRVIDNSSYF